MHPQHIELGSVRRRTRRRFRRARRRESGFTLIEIMAVVLIMGLLASIVGVTVIRQIDKGRVTATRIQIKQLEVALTAFYSDSGFFPSTEQGLEALVERPTIGREPRDYPDGGYLQGGGWSQRSQKVVSDVGRRGVNPKRPRGYPSGMHA